MMKQKKGKFFFPHIEQGLPAFPFLFLIFL